MANRVEYNRENGRESPFDGQRHWSPPRAQANLNERFNKAFGVFPNSDREGNFDQRGVYRYGSGDVNREGYAQRNIGYGDESYGYRTQRDFNQGYQGGFGAGNRQSGFEDRNRYRQGNCGAPPAYKEAQNESSMVNRGCCPVPSNPRNAKSAENSGYGRGCPARRECICYCISGNGSGLGGDNYDRGHGCPYRRECICYCIGGDGGGGGRGGGNYERGHGCPYRRKCICYCYGDGNVGSRDYGNSGGSSHGRKCICYCYC